MLKVLVLFGALKTKPTLNFFLSKLVSRVIFAPFSLALAIIPPKGKSIPAVSVFLEFKFHNLYKNNQDLNFVDIWVAKGRQSLWNLILSNIL